MDSPSAKDLTRQWFERVWNKAGEGAILALMHPEGEILGLGTTVLGRESFTVYARLFQSGFDQIRIDLAEIVAEGDAVAGHARFTALHRSSRREVDVYLSFSAHFEDGLLRRMRHLVDFTGLLSQVGTLDPRAVNLLFGG